MDTSSCTVETSAPGQAINEGTPRKNPSCDMDVQSSNQPGSPESQPSNDRLSMPHDECMDQSVMKPSILSADNQSKSASSVQNDFEDSSFPPKVVSDAEAQVSYSSPQLNQCAPTDNDLITSNIPSSGNEDMFEYYSTLEEFGYKFNDEGALTKIDSAGYKKFDFHYYDDRKKNQKRYEALGKIIEKHIYHLLEEAGLKKFPVPHDAMEGESQTFVFGSPDLLESSAEKPLLILIHGSGVVRAGQWARRLIINDCLDSGTQLPYIKKAMELGYNVLVLNTNDNKDEESGNSIRGSEDPIEHTLHVWDNYVLKSNPANVAIVAHSFGGICTSFLAKERQSTFIEKVFAVAFTDSVHSPFPRGKFKHLREVGRNWCASIAPLDTKLEEMSERDMMAVSAGHNEHEWTSYSAFESVFEFIEEKRAALLATDAHVENGNNIDSERCADASGDGAVDSPPKEADESEAKKRKCTPL